jgi:Zn-dependent protease with chaperone function
VLVTGVTLLPAVSRAAQAPRFKTGFNLFSAAQDVQIGKENVAEIEKQLPLLKDPEIERYVSNLGRHLVEFAPGNTDYPWTFKVVNSQDINAFALPGGFIYVNRGVLEAADSEAEVAGVIAHETGHVVMRHGTHQASQAMLAKMPLAILGGVLGQSSSITAQLAQAGIGLGVGSLMLKNSRSAESQADEVGTYILYTGGYDPHAMAQFFEIIQQKYPQRTLQFFSDHPNPENRIKAVDALIPTLGPEKHWQADSADFRSMKKRVMGLPPPPKAAAQPGSQPAAQPAATAPSAPPPAPSSKLVSFRGEKFSISHPDNWEVQQGKETVTVAPKGGIFQDANGGWAQAYGASISSFVPNKNAKIEDATAALIKSWQQSNPSMRIISQNRIKVRGRKGLSSVLENDSPLAGQKETDQLVTVPGSGVVIAVVLIAPKSEFNAYQPTFQRMINSLDVR